MLLSYKENKHCIISIISLILDGVIVYFMPSYFNQINYFYPMLTISFLPFLYDSNLKKYYRRCFILGIVYDLLYSNIFLFNAFLFLLMAKIDSKILKIYKNSFIIYFFLFLINLLLYDGTSFLLVLITKYQSVTVNHLIYKIVHSLPLNFLSIFVYSFLCRNRGKTHKM